MLDCTFERTFVTAGQNRYTLQNRSRVFKLLHLSVRFAVRFAVTQTGRASDSWRWKRALAAPAALRGAGQIRTLGNGVKQGRGRSEKMRIEGEDGSRRLNRGPPVGARPTAPPRSHPSPLRTSSKAHPSPPPSSSRTQDNALYSLITLSNWRALRSRVLGIIKTNQHECFFFSLSQPLPHPLEGESRGGGVFGGGLERKKQLSLK